MASCMKCGLPLLKAERSNIGLHPNGFVHKDCDKALAKPNIVHPVTKKEPKESVLSEMKPKVRTVTKKEIRKTDPPFPPESDRINYKDPKELTREWEEKHGIDKNEEAHDGD